MKKKPRKNSPIKDAFEVVGLITAGGALLTAPVTVRHFKEDLKETLLDYAELTAPIAKNLIGPFSELPTPSEKNLYLTVRDTHGTTGNAQTNVAPGYMMTDGTADSIG